MRIPLRYFVIYTLDVDPLRSIPRQRNPIARRWTLTERGTNDDGLPGWKHRKYVAEIPPSTLRRFLDQWGYVSTCQTMGSIGFRGFQWIPAISIEPEGDEDAFENAYVSPFIPEDFEEELAGRIEKLDPVSREEVRRRVGNKLGEALDALLALEDDFSGILEEFEVDPDQFSLDFRKN